MASFGKSWRRALKGLAFGERGPVDGAALAWLAASCSSDTIGYLLT
jgi:hypothetical protein